MIVLNEIPLENMAVFGAKPVAEVDLGFEITVCPPRLVWRSRKVLGTEFPIVWH